MKTVFLPFALFTAGLLSVSGQNTPPVPSGQGQAGLLNNTASPTPDEIEAMARFQAETISTVFNVRLQVDGVLPRVARAASPWQLISPFAPASYGSGLDNLSISPSNGKAEGISFFTLKF